jgi:hypothetical protein
MFTYTIEPTRKSPAGFAQVMIHMTDSAQTFGPFHTEDEAHAYAAEMGWTPATLYTVTRRGVSTYTTTVAATSERDAAEKVAAGGIDMVIDPERSIFRDGKGGLIAVTTQGVA